MPIVIAVELPFAGLLIDLVSGAVAIIAGLSGLLGGAAHYRAVLVGRRQHQVEIRTGAGFFAGMVVGACFVLADLIV